MTVYDGNGIEIPIVPFTGRWCQSTISMCH